MNELTDYGSTFGRKMASLLIRILLGNLEFISNCCIGRTFVWYFPFRNLNLVVTGRLWTSFQLPVLNFNQRPKSLNMVFAFAPFTGPEFHCFSNYFIFEKIVKWLILLILYKKKINKIMLTIVAAAGITDPINEIYSDQHQQPSWYSHVRPSVYLSVWTKRFKR